NDSVVKGFPLGTLAVNLAGCFLLGVLYGFFDRGALINQELRIFLTIGLCGGFTTFSTFMNENFLMAQGAQFFTLLLYAVLSLGGGFLTLWLGYTLLKAA
ncbi:fluoride efflux transporter FluC, partial [Akkermansia sp.]